MSTLTNKTALIFGASSGIGEATARLFAQEGANVVIAARSADKLEIIAAAIGPRAIPVVADVTDRPAVERAVLIAVDQFGGLDIMVNSAGVNIPRERRSIRQLAPEDWDRVIGVNLSGAYNTTRAALPALGPGGLIIQIASIASRYQDQTGAAYQASKAGLLAFCQGVMLDQRDIRVTAILPGFVDTGMAVTRPAAQRAAALRPEDVAHTCHFAAGLSAHTYVPEVIILPGQLQVLGTTAITP